MLVLAKNLLFQNYNLFPADTVGADQKQNGSWQYGSLVLLYDFADSDVCLFIIIYIILNE